MGHVMEVCRKPGGGNIQNTTKSDGKNTSRQKSTSHAAGRTKNNPRGNVAVRGGMQTTKENSQRKAIQKNK